MGGKRVDPNERPHDPMNAREECLPKRSHVNGWRFDHFPTCLMMIRSVATRRRTSSSGESLSRKLIVPKTVPSLVVDANVCGMTASMAKTNLVGDDDDNDD